MFTQLVDTLLKKVRSKKQKRKKKKRKNEAMCDWSLIMSHDCSVLCMSRLRTMFLLRRATLPIHAYRANTFGGLEAKGKLTKRMLLEIFHPI